MSDIPAPTWNQNVDDNPGGQPIDPLHASNCGSQVAAMIVYACRGVELPEETVRLYMHADPNRALTTEYELAGYLAGEHCHLNAEVDHQPWPHIQQTITTQLERRYPVAVLGHWYGPDALHWVLAVGYDHATLHYNDPEDGTRRHINWDLYARTVDAGTVVLCHEEARYA